MNQDPNLLFLGSKLLTPLSKKDLSERVERIQECVDHFKPKIEEKTGFQLGEIKVKTTRDFEKKLYKESKKIGIIGRNSSLLEKLGTKIEAKKTGFLLNLTQSIFSYPQFNDIFVSKGSETKRLVYYNLTGHDTSEIDFQSTAHEMGRILWRNIVLSEKNSIPYYNGGIHRNWIEGFAEFCEKEYFYELYPEGIFPNLGYLNSKFVPIDLARKVFENEGEDTFLKIPLEWNKLSLKYNLKSMNY